MQVRTQRDSRQWANAISNAETRGASRGIENTIQAVEESLGTSFPRGRTPSESRQIMKEIPVRVRLRP